MEVAPVLFLGNRITRSNLLLRPVWFVTTISWKLFLPKSVHIKFARAFSCQKTSRVDPYGLWALCIKHIWLGWAVGLEWHSQAGCLFVFLMGRLKRSKSEGCSGLIYPLQPFLWIMQWGPSSPTTTKFFLQRMKWKWNLYSKVQSLNHARDRICW